jgi:hypothetical protein
MIEEYYYKPNLVPPLSFFVYVYWILWKLIDMCQQSKKVSPTSNNTSNKSTNKKKLNDDRAQNLISNWTNDVKFYG